MRRSIRGWRLLLFARCEHASRIDSDEWDGPVARDRWWAARLHRLACGPCQREHKRLAWLRKMLEAAPAAIRQQQARAATAKLSPEAAQRIRAVLAEARDQERDFF